MGEIYYLSRKQVQEELLSYELKHSARISRAEAMSRLIRKGQTFFTTSEDKLMMRLHQSDKSEFLKLKEEIAIEISEDELNNLATDVTAHLKPNTNVFIQGSYSHELSEFHTHTNFEVVYIYSGCYNFYFLDECKAVSEGDLIFISRNARHKFEESMPGDNFFMSFFISYEVLRASFLSMLSEHDFLAQYIKTILTNRSNPNYLLISTPDIRILSVMAQNVFLEQYRYDEYSPHCTQSYLQLFFANAMRHHTTFHQYKISMSKVDMGPILDYIDKNYKTKNLGEIAEHFNYSESYISMQIQKATGKKYINLITELRLAEALDYLSHTDLSVKEVALNCGYNDVDHFSKTFKKAYGLSPREFKSQFTSSS